MIGILFTGGTISMKRDPATGAAVPAMGSADILAQVPHLADIADIEAEDFSRLPGPHVTPDQMWRLARRAAAWLERPDVDGLVITHGTDTMEETAWLLDLVLTTDKPVALVGAMRTVSDPSWDGPANLLAAVRAAADRQLRAQGVVVVMADQILPARDVRKVHTESPASFAAPEFGPIGIVDGDVVVVRRARRDRPTWRDPRADAGLRVARLETRVELLDAYTGMGDAAVRVLTGSAKGLAVAAFGRGNVPPAIVPALGEAIDRGVLVTVSSRSEAGRVSTRYGYEGGGRQLADMGVVLMGSLPAAKARLLLMAVLGYAADRRSALEVIAATVPESTVSDRRE